ncbi:MAG: hypothetical protein HY275_17435 [Gemmatimonadetes bacterium]|nr:hypothetical protein [Gemmatimonadota bacterium]
MIARVMRRAALALAAVAPVLVAQVPTPPPIGGPLPTMPGAENPHGPAATGPREVEGRVERLTRGGPTPVGGVMVTLHRVGPDKEGPVDSVRTDASGRYRIRYRATGSANAIYFAATSWQGIAYFTAPLRATRVEGNAARLSVFDTTSREAALTVRGRHLIVSSADSSGSRVVIEVYELSNDSSKTLVGADSASATLTVPVPTGAREVMVGQGDVPPDATTTGPGVLRVLAPFSPGLKQLSFSYRLGKEAFPAAFPLERAASVLEVLVEDPSAAVSGAALKNVGPVAADGRTFKRFLGENIAAGGAVTVSTPGTLATKTNLYILGVAFAVGVGLLGGLARTAFRSRGMPRAVVLTDDPEVIAREIADLDRAHARQGAAADPERANYEQARAALKERLTVALARRDGDA